ncbi:DUF2069 domain-containing protein [Dyella sp.]|uniref:DUF2069 domain-containing protein n=1 Tax=Dyella sp. TaxID=1869338 RepID=UPI002ED1BDB1
MSAITTTYRVGLAAWAVLLGLQLAWYLWLFPPATMPLWLVMLLTVLPLLLPLFSLPNVRRALLWTGILSLFYFCHGIAEAWSASGERWLALLEVALTLLLIGALGAGVRRKRQT